MLTKSEYWRVMTPPNVRAKVLAGAICTYVSAGASILAALYIGFATAILEGCALLAVGLGVQIGKSRACAIAMLAYYAFSKLYMLSLSLMTGPTLLLSIVYAAVLALAVSGTFRFQEAWERYQAEYMAHHHGQHSAKAPVRRV